MQEKNNSTRTKQLNLAKGETTQLCSRNETTQLASRNEQLNSSVGTKQLNSALPSTAYNRLQPPTTACNRLQPPATAYNRLQPPATACTACTAFTAESAFSVIHPTYILLTPGLLATDLIILNHGEVTRTTPELPLLTSTPHQWEDVWASTDLTCIVGLQRYKARTHDTPVTSPLCVTSDMLSW
ncbi:hypothetical protein TNCV_308241 [Trichonephila clavipes]|nr:hypothetical protein TNCV_308241 [Trichonephila clavipes]